MLGARRRRVKSYRLPGRSENKVRKHNAGEAAVLLITPVRDPAQAAQKASRASRNSNCERSGVFRWNFRSSDLRMRFQIILRPSHHVLFPPIRELAGSFL